MQDAATFDELVQRCLVSGLKYRLLYVFVRVAQMDSAARQDMGIAEDEDAAMVQVLFDAQQPAEPGLTFEHVRKAADEHNPDWTLCVVNAIHNSDSTPPSEEQGQALLAEIRDKILAGDVDDYAVIDKSGRNVLADTPQDAPPAHTVN